MLILDGDVAQRLVASLRGGTMDPTLTKAAQSAASRSWDALAAALPASPDESVPGFVLRAMASFAKRQYVDAAAGFQAAFDRDKSSGATAFLLGWAHSASGDDIAAISAWRAATVATPALVPPYLALADAYMRQGQRPLALQAVQAGLSASPKSIELQSRLAELQRSR
jgi:tetratricopeptide (TPR) repeat protein